MAPTHQLEIKAGLQVLTPVHEVFEAIVDPDKMKNYFICQSSGTMQEGEKLTWKFAEMDVEFPVTIEKIEKDKYISFHWDGAMDGEETLVEINLKSTGDDKTYLTITEKSKPNNEAGIVWLRRNTEGWANFLACLKAWMEYGINLRKGAFAPSQLPQKEN